MIRLGITGTDTGVGKTVVTCALAAALRARDVRVVAMKPIETGVAFDDPRRDGARLARAAGHPDALHRTAPIVLSRPLAPLAAARHENTHIDLSQLDAAVESAAGADVLLVEGAGGLMVPIAPEITFLDLFLRWSLDVVIVAGNRLGVVNHTLLTVRAALSSGLGVAAIVLNDLSAEPPDESASGNLDLLRELVPAIPIVSLPWIADVDDLHSLANGAVASALVAVAAPGAKRVFVKRKEI